MWYCPHLRRREPESTAARSNPPHRLLQSPAGTLAPRLKVPLPDPPMQNLVWILTRLLKLIPAVSPPRPVEKTPLKVLLEKTPLEVLLEKTPLEVLLEKIPLEFL